MIRISFALLFIVVAVVTCDHTTLRDSRLFPRFVYMLARDHFPAQTHYWYFSVDYILIHASSLCCNQLSPELLLSLLVAVVDGRGPYIGIKHGHMCVVVVWFVRRKDGVKLDYVWKLE